MPKQPRLQSLSFWLAEDTTAAHGSDFLLRLPSRRLSIITITVPSELLLDSAHLDPLPLLQDVQLRWGLSGVFGQGSLFSYQSASLAANRPSSGGAGPLGLQHLHREGSSSTRWDSHHRFPEPIWLGAASSPPLPLITQSDWSNLTPAVEHSSFFLFF